MKCPGAITCFFSAGEFGTIDSISVIRLDEHLGRLTVHDLRQLKTKIPLETLKTAVDLAVDIGREGREGNRSARCLSWAITARCSSFATRWASTR